MTVFQAKGDKREESAKREEQNIILSRSSPRVWLTLRPNNLDITVSFGNIPIILIIPFINALFFWDWWVSRVKKRVAHGIQVQKKKKKRNKNERNNNDDNDNNNNNDNDNNYNDNNTLLLLNVVNCDETKLFLVFV